MSKLIYIHACTLTDPMSTLNSSSVSLAFDTFPAVRACRQAALTADVTPRMQLSSNTLVVKMLHSFTEVSPHFSDERKDVHKLPWLANCFHFLMRPLSPAKTAPLFDQLPRLLIRRLLRISGRPKVFDFFFFKANFVLLGGEWGWVSACAKLSDEN